MRPGVRQVGAQKGIQQEAEADDGKNPPYGAAHGLHDQQDQRGAEENIPGLGARIAVGEIVAAHDQVRDDGDGQQRERPVPCHDAMAEAPRYGEHHEAQEQHEGDVHGAQDLRRHDGVGGVQVEQRHGHRDDGHEGAEPAGQAVGGAFLLLDVFLGLAQRLVVDDGGRVRMCCGGH